MIDILIYIGFFGLMVYLFLWKTGIFKWVIGKIR